MGRLERQLRQAVERASAGLHGPDGHRQATLAVTRRALARIRAAHELATTLDDGVLATEPEPDIDWAQVNVDALAEVYERLLGHEPSTEHARKRSGTYYTPPELVDRLLDETLEPVLEQVCAGPDPAAALLRLRVCDPACGSGRFLVAAARRMAARLLALDDRDLGPAARGAIIERCIYGVDIDPIAIELCRLSLELEAGGHASNRHDRLRCGDALLGAPVEHAPSWARADAWCSAIVWPAHASDDRAELDPAQIRALAAEYRFFHWSLAFPEVFESGGFDVILGNPPWEMLEQAGTRRSARRAGARRLLEASGRFPRTAAARKNLYALFAELGDSLCRPTGRLGMILPTEVVQGAIADRLARPWFEARRCAAVFDFQNRPAIPSAADKWFPAVHPQLRFSLVCLAPSSDAPVLCADAASIADTRDPARIYRHEVDALLRMCRGSFRLPLVRGPVDRRIHERAYARGRPLAELLAEPGVVARLLFNFGASDNAAKLAQAGPKTLRVYEGQHIHQYNHRWATHSRGRTTRVMPESLGDPEFAITTADQLPRELVHARLRTLVGDPLPEFLLVLRRQARAADAHVGIAAIVPAVATEGSLTCFVGLSGPVAALLCASFSSFAFNYLLEGRQTGPNVNRGLLAELPILDRRVAEHPRFDLRWFCERVVELCYTATELEPFARACGHAGPPFIWSTTRRHELRCELEAALFCLYGFTPDEAAHALDRFEIVARRERAEFGEFRSKRRILEELTAMQTADPISG